MRPEQPPPAEAVALLDRLRELVREQWTLHFLVVIPAQIAAEIFREAYAALRGDADDLAPYRLLEGVAVEADVEIARLAQRARELGVDDLVRELRPEDLAPLRRTQPGRVWLHELDAYLLRFGGRSRWHELSLPREAELPTMTLESLRLLLEGGVATPAAPEPEPVPEELSDLYERVRPAHALKELHSYDIDYPGLLATREALLGFGRRVAAEGLLDGTEDVWMLTFDELRDALRTGTSDLRSLVAERRAELAAARPAGPKPYLGEPPAAAERHEALERFYGSGGTALEGVPAAPGSAEGPARVVAGPADFARIQPGDVLVTTTTTPAWTPLFPSLGALVTETGGILCHAAVVAREYRIPAVVGARGATTEIPDGARVRVDGSSGEITLLTRLTGEVSFRRAGRSSWRRPFRKGGSDEVHAADPSGRHAHPVRRGGVGAPVRRRAERGLRRLQGDQRDAWRHPRRPDAASRDGDHRPRAGRHDADHRRAVRRRQGGARRLPRFSRPTTSTPRSSSRRACRRPAWAVPWRCARSRSGSDPRAGLPRRVGPRPRRPDRLPRRLRPRRGSRPGGVRGRRRALAPRRDAGEPARLAGDHRAQPRDRPHPPRSHARREDPPARGAASPWRTRWTRRRSPTSGSSSSSPAAIRRSRSTPRSRSRCGRWAG